MSNLANNARKIDMEDYRRQHRQAIREFVLNHHPDRGGDPAVFIAGLTELRQRTLNNHSPNVVVAQTSCVWAYQKRSPLRGLLAAIGARFVSKPSRVE